MFYWDESGEISSTQYSLIVSEPTSVWITISPSPSQSTATPTRPVDMCLLVLRNKPDRQGNSLITFTERRDVTGVSITGSVWMCVCANFSRSLLQYLTLSLISCSKIINFVFRKIPQWKAVGQKKTINSVKMYKIWNETPYDLLAPYLTQCLYA